ncbi:glycogen/starch/alpha-glucan phosphorylase [Megalodesulfovibrio gigas]|uniref:glycogen/starch/alpha-glucan phosphorylase n=1 Tax=Megalodesulfovibrio gigas TaxID=879 RepID=UPI000416B3D5|nr:glycogen/starch/alpha-glucan phosphorylase [Megalodesulfovibrio gigas]
MATPKQQRQTFDPQRAFAWSSGLYDDDSVEGLKKDVIRHVVSSLGSDYASKSAYNYYNALALAVRDRLIDNWIKTQRSYYDEKAKRVYYLSLEYLPGKSLMNNLHCLGIYETARKAMSDLGFSLEDLAEQEWDAGLGNGGLGRLASCFLDSMATLGIPGYGYGIRYDYGIFHQVIEDGKQVEQADNWMRVGNPWAYERGQHLFPVRFFGEVKNWTDEYGRLRHTWTAGDTVLAMPCDMLVPGWDNHHVINMRLWSARSDVEFDLDFFNTGNYLGAVEEKIFDEKISKVLYPSDQIEEGRELRLKQQYFFVTATIQDILRRFRKKHQDMTELPQSVAIQLNDTHPAIAIAELMRILLDEDLLDWEVAWDICVSTFAYTNHTILPEALETWPVSLLERMLPRHMQIIYEINARFLREVERVARSEDCGQLCHRDLDHLKQRVSLIQERPIKSVRMAHLAIIGSHSVNGVAALHTELLKARVFDDFQRLYPQKINNKTNGVTPRRWLWSANQPLSRLIASHIGTGFVRNLDELTQLEPLAADPAFREAWRAAKLENKQRLQAYIKRKLMRELHTEHLFDVHIKRIHEYKRQVLNLLHVVTAYNRLRHGQAADFTPRTVFFGGKAAPSYFMAKRIIHAINAVAATVNADSRVNDKLQVVYLPNYCVSQAERVIPATELSEQISTAGMEASGTGNMKFALNGALTIGTWDGATIEMAQAIGPELLFIFGMREDELVSLRQHGYNPMLYYHGDEELREALDMLRSDAFSPGQHGLFAPLVDNLLHGGDRFFVLADYRQYLGAQQDVGRLYLDQEEWTRRSILNAARMGFFSSDRAISQYAREIWDVAPMAGLQNGKGA